jgi:multisubunit Na+/H+ antiporter MnhC subunit
VLTAIVIGFGMTAYIVTLALRGLSESGTTMWTWRMNTAENGKQKPS